MKNKGKTATRAARFLLQKGIWFELVQYEHGEKGAEFAAQATGFPLNRTLKTLVADLGEAGYVLALMPGDRQLDLKALARALGAKRSRMADTATAERLTGYLLGGISPFGVKQPLPAVMDASVLAHERVMINAGARGLMLQMAPSDIQKALDCLVAEIARDD